MERIITIPGKPMGKGRPRFSRGVTYTPKKTVEYENLVRLVWLQSGYEKLNGCVKVDIRAYMAMPKAWSKKKRAAMHWQPYPHKPDVDNICKVILDPLNGLAYDDDAQVVDQHCVKFYSENPMVIVTLEEVPTNVCD